MYPVQHNYDFMGYGIYKMKTLKLTLILFITGTAFLKGFSNTENSRIDWLRGTLLSEAKDPMKIDFNGNPADEETGAKTSIAQSRDASYNRAKEKAVRGAVTLISNIPVDPQTTVRDLLLKDISIRQKVNIYIHEFSRFREISAGYLNSSCQLEFKLGYLIDAIGITFPEDDFPQRDDIVISTKYTSLIIDTRGLQIKPMLLPSVINENGLEIYGRKHVSGKIAVKELIVAYTFNEREAMKHKKAGNKPFFCTALKSLHGNPVISDDDIKRIFSHRDTFSYLKKCKVIFIIDR